MGAAAEGQENGEAPDREAKLLDAIKYNQKVWSFFQAELSALTTIHL